MQLESVMKRCDLKVQLPNEIHEKGIENTDSGSKLETVQEFQNANFDMKRLTNSL